MKKLSLALGALCLVGTASFGCAAPPAEEEKASTSSEMVAEGGESVCELVGAAAAVSVAALVATSQATGGCVVVMSVTGAGEVVCLAPLAGAAVSTVAALVTGTVAWLTCATFSAQVTATSTTARTPPDRCTQAEADARQATKEYWCNSAKNDYGQDDRTCGGTKDYLNNPKNLSCADAQMRAWLNNQCASYRSYVMDCWSTRPPEDNHGDELDTVSGTAARCQGLVSLLCEGQQP